MNRTVSRIRTELQDSAGSKGSSTDSSNPESARRSLELGVVSTDPVIEGRESHEAWVVHRDIVVQELNPVGELETFYAERAALYLWRLNRVIRYEVTATQFDLDDVFAEFIVSLNHPELPRDRSEAVTVEMIRKPLNDYLDEFVKLGAKAAKLPELKEGLDRVRTAAKRVSELRILPDRPTIQTIIKYEAHLERCLSKTMAELRRLQKERRQGLRRIIEKSAVRHPVNTPEAPAPDDFGNEIRETIEKANREVDLEESPDLTTRRSAEQEIPATEPINGKANLQESRHKGSDPTLDARLFASTFINPKTHTNMKQPYREILTRDDPPKTDDSAVPIGVAQACPIAPEPPLHQKE